MKILGLSRSVAACVAAGLFVWAQAAGFAQALATPTFAPRPQQVVITKTDAYLPGPAQMIAPATIDDIAIHPQGRYALVFQKDATLPPKPLMGKATTGAADLLLYDARLRKTRPLWQRRADGGEHSIVYAKWLPGTDCAVVVTSDTPPANGEVESTTTSSVLFFNFEKNTVPRLLATAAGEFSVDVSPTKPVFVLRDWEGKQAHMVSAPRGTIGPVMSNLHFDYTVYPCWNTNGTTVYGIGEAKTKTTPDAKPQSVTQWFEWDGKTPDATPLNAKPTKVMIDLPIE